MEAACRSSPASRASAFSVTVIWELGDVRTRQPAGEMCTGMPLSTAVPDSGSSSVPSMSWLTLTPGCAGRDRQPGAAAGRGPSRAAGTPRRAAWRRCISTGATTSPPAPLTDGDVVDAESGGVVGVDLQGAAVGAAGQRGHVVHPAVVGAQVAPADEHEAVVRPRSRERAAGPHRRRRPPAQLDLARRCPQHLGQPRLQRAEVDAVRVRP